MCCPEVYTLTMTFERIEHVTSVSAEVSVNHHKIADNDRRINDKPIKPGLTRPGILPIHPIQPADSRGHRLGHGASAGYSRAAAGPKNS